MASSRSLYRSLLRQIHLLPTPLLQSHFTSLSRSLLLSPSPSDHSHRLPLLLRHLLATNAGHLHSLTRSLELAYGIRGKLSHHPDSKKKWPILDPSLAPMPPRGVKGTREERLLGPLTEQRKKAIRKRWVRAMERKGVGTRLSGSDEYREEVMKELMENVKVVDGLIPSPPKWSKDTLKPPIPTTSTSTRRTRIIKPKEEVQSLRPPVSRGSIKWGEPHVLTNRFLRRRFEAVLDKVEEGKGWRKGKEVNQWSEVEQFWSTMSENEPGEKAKGKRKGK